jgi:hypothetical protein
VVEPTVAIQRPILGLSPRLRSYIGCWEPWQPGRTLLQGLLPREVVFEEIQPLLLLPVSNSQENIELAHLHLFFNRLQEKYNLHFFLSMHKQDLDFTLGKIFFKLFAFVMFRTSNLTQQPTICDLRGKFELSDRQPLPCCNYQLSIDR